jgi:hypothetical protein
MSLNTNSSTLDFDVLLDSNANFTPQGSDIKLLVKNIAENVIYRKEPVQSKNTNSFQFSFDIDSYFLNRGVWCNIENIPLLVNLNDVTGVNDVELKEENFHTELFKDYKYLTLKHLGFHNCINSFKVNIDGENIDTNNASECLSVVSCCYDEDDINKHFDASQSDYVSNDILLTDTVKYVPTFGLQNNTECRIKKPEGTLDINSPYSAVTNTKNNSRIPLFTSFKAGAGKSNLTTTKHKLNLSNLTFWLPFNILSISSESNISIYNGKKMTVLVNLHNNWVPRLFNSIPYVDATGKNQPRYSFSLDTAAYTGNTSGEINCYAKLYHAPQQIESLRNLNDKYIMEYPLVELDTRTTDVVFAESKPNTQINSTPFDLRAIPSKIFIAVTPKSITDEDHMINNTHFARFNSLYVEMMGTKTELATGNGAESLYILSKKNGLNMNKQTALFTKGFPVILDVSDDLGCKTNSYIGINTANSSGKYTLRVSGDVTRLHVEGALDHTQKQKTYELKCIFTYVAYFAYNLMGRRFAKIESLSSDTLNTLNARLDGLYLSMVPRINIIGGAGIWAMLGDKMKGVASGLKNVISAVISNKNGIRDKLKDAYMDGSGNIIGGSDGHNPLGGAMLNNWGAY